VTSLLIVIQALLWEKLSVYYQSRHYKPKNQKRWIIEYQTNFYMNFHLKGDLRLEFIV